VDSIQARGVVLARERGLSVYDALIVAAAQDAGCPLLLSEDLQPGQKFGTLTVENPFRSETG
jgi:predicted nucleic acid-binding protein